eukprot:CAMPEP_0185588942 /NCGR_PEP_ID=MMETSP0434-20130131/55047_1 /TAXON_ID=626734 ORGANISM="Favella taraikaensis, Strain Fe Narragansett Bay" /NCGR_SAMPLE_ID=MMETSP0434 /ASSEMBLY_ACC=CAM_ASM_000379 /LENGTH=56 /DNA_ID=CAMNT_0028211951 /DNA_START=565 /DNA_END=735 /DNA_ORIENTATION=+
MKIEMMPSQQSMAKSPPSKTGLSFNTTTVPGVNIKTLTTKDGGKATFFLMDARSSD